MSPKWLEDGSDPEANAVNQAEAHIKRYLEQSELRNFDLLYNLLVGIATDFPHQLQVLYKTSTEIVLVFSVKGFTEQGFVIPTNEQLKNTLFEILNSIKSLAINFQLNQVKETVDKIIATNNSQVPPDEMPYRLPEFVENKGSSAIATIKLV